ncbi:NAD(P)-dependent dehydrogenase (short-subunit alcohol dehydrogenase family) [Rhodococcus sp. PvR044]|jgi:NAD(P)-dependent dehydrogenase (short-subunit alcohol dehydrogenase family)|uniref:SDR family NAD(P)-dependent oxidoreductase n=1 Tax=Rhodococcus TaxID=1827 RepID=UPI000BC51987|nr:MULTISPECIES: SDR family oxidoreductase [Rhodococcus]MBP1162974.1 NAD(P)-dependent dehydrogenase (short-subunit alcohol dehydrogenase family) [Rhodococcus sp. PvR099]MCZ4554692.1 SDR family NAD(P)-dependent oxidoreductase [Rhodococcus maanshanensis]PTR44337.1 NAD(P)-dependent dehydrogenase (short-subunit alcohol dehydrogenase family) [Rhodococcus sp. OK611]SNX89778.1 NAD(P)-dependent dehydrogenase, short-chain alcohol dehydrogenase family [Rhodococcus sp. OK270]
MNRFEGRKTLITGAGSGIGQATVARILAEGGVVAAADVSEEGLAVTRARAEEAGAADRLTTVVVDISNEASVQEAIGGAIKDLGGLQVLINAAGILRASHTHETSLDFWNKVIGVNLTGTFLVTREALPALVENGQGVVVNFSSTSASFAHPYMAAYAATKGGIRSFTHAIALEYAKAGLRAVAVEPGSIASGMTSNPGFPEHDLDPTLIGKLYPWIGEGFAPPEDVAGVIAMLASDDGKFVTGTEIRIDGGTHM